MKKVEYENNKVKDRDFFRFYNKKGVDNKSTPNFPAHP